MRSRFDSQLALLNTELIQMGALCEEAISKAAKALENGDSTLAEQVKPLEGGIDQMERDIETLCLKLLLQQQPVARDLRQISAAMKIITDMERIAALFLTATSASTVGFPLESRISRPCTLIISKNTIIKASCLEFMLFALCVIC